MERLLRAKFRSNAENFTQNVIRDVRFTAIEKNVHGTKIKPKETKSRLWIENEWEERRGPTMNSYFV